MKKYDLLTPEGTRDLLFDESVAKRTVEERLCRIFKSYGYSEVVTPALEFYDVFNLKTRHFAQESMYKLCDAKGRLMVMRPDSTMPIARLVATRLRDEKYPLKLFYNQNIYKMNPKNSALDDEISQSGIEIIGGDVKRSDIEALALAVDVLKSCDTDDFRLEIGDTAFYKALIAKLSISEDEAEEIRSYIETKNYPALNRALSAYGDSEAVKALKALPELFGGKEVFERAEEYFLDNDTKEILTELKIVYDNICSLGISDKITVDLGLVNKANYYTGILFKGYIEGYGHSVLSGGRYDTLLDDFGVKMAATGFAVNVNATTEALLKKSKGALLRKPDVLVYSKSKDLVVGLKYCQKLTSDGLIVDNAVIEDENEALDYAKSKGMKRVDIISGDEAVRTVLL